MEAAAKPFIGTAIAQRETGIAQKRPSQPRELFF